MSTKKRSDLTRTDIEFLKAVAEVQDNPEKYDGTEKGECPANTSVLRNITDLSEDQLDYRTRKGKRGFEKLGYLEIYESQPTSTGYTPRSVKITDVGRKAIQSWEQKFGGAESVGWDDTTVEQMEAKVGRLESQLETVLERKEELQREVDRLHDRNDELESRLVEIEEDEYGALDDEKVDSIRRAFTRMNSTFMFIRDVLNAPLQNDYDPEQEEEHRRRVREALSDQPED